MYKYGEPQGVSEEEDRISFLKKYPNLSERFGADKLVQYRQGATNAGLSSSNQQLQQPEQQRQLSVQQPEQQRQLSVQQPEQQRQLSVQQRQQTEQQPKKPGLKDTGKAVGQAVATEAVKQGVKGAFSANAGGAGAAKAGGAGAAKAGGAGAAKAGAAKAGAAKAGGAGAAGGGLATAGAVAGGAVAAVNVVDAVDGFDDRRGKGAIEGTAVIIGTTIGAILGGFAGAGLGSVAGKIWGRGLASVADSLGWVGQKSHTQYAQEMWGGAHKAAKTDMDREGIAHFYNLHLKEIEKGKQKGAAVYKEGPLAGRKWNWKDVKNTSTGIDMAGEYGFFQAFPDWISGYTEEQRAQIAQAALDHDLLIHDPKRGRIFSEKEGDLDTIQEISLQIKEGTYVPLYTDEERYQDKQEYLQMLYDTEGYESPELGKPYEPPTRERGVDTSDDDDVVQETATVEEKRGEGTRRPLNRRPKPKPILNDIPKPEPVIRSPKDYAQAYLDIYNANTGRY